jgi:hypothetical protein
MALNEYLPPLDFCSSPWVINFSKSKTEESRTTFINPFNGSFFKASLPTIEGRKQLLRCFGDWLLIFDEGTQECFLVNITSYSKVSLPPLLHPIDSLGSCALSSPTPPDCTVMFACSVNGRFVLHCRPGDKEWIKHNIDFQDDLENFAGTIFGSKGKMYVNTTYNGQCVIINNTTSGSYVEKMGITDPDTCPLNLSNASFWVESDGDIFLVRFYLHTYQGLGVTDIDIHRMDTSINVWKKVDNIGSATFFLGSNCVAVPSVAAGTQADCIYLLLWCCDGMRLYTARLNDRTISFSVLPTFAVDLQNLSSCIDIWQATYWAIPQR